MKLPAILSILCLSHLLAGPALAGSGDIRAGTIVPGGTSYCNALREMGDTWHKAMPEKVNKFILSAGTRGEADLVREMRSGNQQVGLLSVVGLSEIDPSVSALQKIPLLFRSQEEVTIVRKRLERELNQKLEARGFVVLFWAEAGWVRFFSAEPAVRPADFKKLKIFTWKGDGQQVELMKKMGYQPVELETQDIASSLGRMIDCVPSVPFYALFNQFDLVAKHMLELKWVPMVGACVMTREAWYRYSPAEQKTLLAAARLAGEKICEAGQREDQESIEAMRQRGLKVHSLTPEAETEWRTLAESVYPQISGVMVPKESFDKVVSILKEIRSSPSQK